MGIDGDNGWGARPHEEYAIPCKTWAYRFRLRPLAAGDDPVALTRQAF